MGNTVNAPHLYSIVSYFGLLIGLLYDFVSLVLFALIVYNGFRYLFSGVNPELKEKAQKGLKYAILGLVVIVFAYIFIVFVGSFVSNRVFTQSFISGSPLQFNLSNLSSSS